MSKLLQRTKNGPRPASAAGQPYPTNGGRVPTSAFSTLAPKLALVLAVAGLLSCSDDTARRENSELRVEAPAATSPSGPEAAVAQQATAEATPGQRYRVLAGTAYFYTSPEQAKPTGQYLLRGDVLHGQDAGNGFVKTQFVNPQGATVTGWLKAEELGQLAAAPAARPPRPRPAAAPISPAPVADAEDARLAASPPPAQSTNSSSSSQTAVVRVARAYFYNSPDLAQPRKAYCEQGDKVRLGQEQGEAVYVTFTNWEKVTTKGWMKKETLRFSR